MIFLSCAAPAPDIIVIFLLSFVRIFQFGYNTKSGCAMCANVCQAARVENIFPGPRTSEYFLRGIFFLVITEIHRSMHRAQSCTPTHFQKTQLYICGGRASQRQSILQHCTQNCARVKIQCCKTALEVLQPSKKTHLIKCCLASRRARRTKVFLLIKDSLSAAVFLRPAGREIIKLAASMGFQGFLLRPVETLRR